MIPRPTPLLEVNALKKHFPIRGGVFGYGCIACGHVLRIGRFGRADQTGRERESEEKVFSEHGTHDMRPRFSMG